MDSATRICMVGSSMVDLIARVPRLPAAGETLVGSEFHMGFGGKGSNQAVMAARLGAQVSVVVKLGRDQFGENTLQNYREQGIDTTFVSFDEERSSGVAPITVDEETGQNVVIVVPGANLSLSPDDVHRAAATIRSSSVLMCQLETPIPATLSAFRIAKESSGTLAVLNPAPAADLPEELLRLTDVFVPNEVEAATLTGQPVKTREEAFEAAASLIDRGPRTVVVTLGDRGAVCLERGGEPFHVEAQQVRAVDSTGAGDAFVGSLAYFLGSRTPLAEAVRKACAVATRSVLKHGTQTSFPYGSQLKELFTETA
jgi:ribokinase